MITNKFTISRAYSHKDFFLSQALSHPSQIRCKQKTPVRFVGWEDPLEKEIATHSSILAWRIPWTEEPGGLWSTGWQQSDTADWPSTRTQINCDGVLCCLCTRIQTEGAVFIWDIASANADRRENLAITNWLLMFPHCGKQPTWVILIVLATYCCITNHFKTQWLKTIIVCYLTVSMGQEFKLCGFLMVSYKTAAAAASSEGLSGVGGSTSKVSHSQDWPVGAGYCLGPQSSPHAPLHGRL